MYVYLIDDTKSANEVLFRVRRRDAKAHTRLDKRRRRETYNHHRCIEILKSQYTGYVHVVRRRILTHM
jgi:hypothetical protein